MRKIFVTAAAVLAISMTGVFAQQDSTKHTMSSANYTKPQQPSKPETNAQKESGLQQSTESIQGKSGTQGQVPVTQTKPVAGSKAQNESGVQGETSGLQGKSGTQGQTTQGETSEKVEQEATSNAAIPTETPNIRDTQYRTEDKVRITNEEIPSGLRETLSNEKFKGWENSELYHDKIRNEYLLELKNANGLQRFRFNHKGKPIGK